MDDGDSQYANRLTRSEVQLMRGSYTSHCLYFLILLVCSWMNHRASLDYLGDFLGSLFAKYISLISLCHPTHCCNFAIVVLSSLDAKRFAILLLEVVDRLLCRYGSRRRFV